MPIVANRMALRTSFLHDKFVIQGNPIGAHGGQGDPVAGFRIELFQLGGDRVNQGRCPAGKGGVGAGCGRFGDDQQVLAVF